MFNNINDLDRASESEFVLYIEQNLGRKLSEQESFTLSLIQNQYDFPKSSLFLALSFQKANGKGIAHLEYFVKDLAAKDLKDYEAVKKEIARLTVLNDLDKSIRTVVGIKEVSNVWRKYYAQWKEWGVSDSDIRNAKWICLKRQRSIIPQYMNGIIKNDLLKRRKKR